MQKNQNNLSDQLKKFFDQVVRDVSDGLDRLTGMLTGKKQAPAAGKAAQTGKDENESAAVQMGPSDFSEKARIKEWLKTVRFRTRMFGGVDEADVWKKIGQLNRMYEQAVIGERARYDALLQHYRLMVGEISEADIESFDESEPLYQPDGDTLPTAFAEYAGVEYDEYDEYDEYSEEGEYSEDEEYPEEYEDDDDLWYSEDDEEEYDSDEYSDSDR